MAKEKGMVLPKDPRYLKYPIDEPFDPRTTVWPIERTPLFVCPEPASFALLAIAGLLLRRR